MDLSNVPVIALKPISAGQPTRITRYYVLALSLLAIAVLGNFGLMQVSLQIQETKVRLSALASEQSRLFIDIGFLTRSLMQSTVSGKVPEGSLDALRSRILEKAGRARSNTIEILALDSSGTAWPFSAGTVSRFYTQPPHRLKEKLDQVIARSEDFARVPTDKLRGRLTHWSPIDVVVASGTLMQEEFDGAMAESYRVSQQNISVLRIIESLVTVIACALIVLEGLCIFAPLVRVLKHEHAQTLQFERELWGQGRQDVLTGLSNRLAFNETLAGLIETHRQGGPAFGLVLFDLDRFKPINDMLGHAAGDFLLTTISARAREAIGPDSFIARLGGDEFGVLVRHMSGADAARRLVDRMKAVIEQPARYADHDLRPIASFGVALFPDHALDAEAVLGAADNALYAAKTARSGVEVYNEAMRAEAETSRQLAADLKQGLAKDELAAFYQPQVRLRDGGLVGFEALIRWNHPVLGMLAPGRFLPVVERYGLMMEITTFMIDRVAADVARWLAAGYEPGRIFVNIPEVLLATDIAQQVFASAIERHGLDYNRIGIEVTEDVLLDRNAMRIRQNLESLRERGMTVSFDDFGTGYASLSHLRAFPFDELKIDRSFIGDLPQDLMSSEIVRSLITLGQRAGKTVIAEGIETVLQREHLVAQGCEIGQGYLFSQPIPFAEATDFIASCPIRAPTLPEPSWAADVRALARQIA